MKKAHEALSRAIKTLLINEPFYGTFTAGLITKFNEEIDTLRVGLIDYKLNLEVNPDYFLSLNKDERVGVLKHEVLHICFGHMVLWDNYEKQKTLNMAMDLEINQYIDSIHLPHDALTLESFKQHFGIELPEKKGTDYYYGAIVDVIVEPDEIPVHAKHDWVGASDDLATENAKTVLTHIIEKKITDIADQIGKLAGNLPYEINSILKNIKKNRKPANNWKRHLKLFIGNSKYTYTRSTKRKLNIRFEDMPGIKNFAKVSVLVGLDVSASVNAKALTAFIEEIGLLKKQDAQITIAQFDTSIKSVKEFKKAEDKYELHGRGGTNFQPVVDLFNSTRKYDCLMIFTDGEASEPNNIPKRTLWALCVDNKNFKFKGLKIFVEP